MNTALLTDAKRLAYISRHEAQESGGSSSWTQGRTFSDEQDDFQATNRPSPQSSYVPLAESEGKGRVKGRRRYMTRSSFQKGYVFSRETDRGKVHVIRYRVRTAEGAWRHKAETVNSPRRKDAERLLAERLREVNRGLRLPVEITFSAFAEDQWKTYVNQNLKLSTQASHNSNLRGHLLPAFGRFRLAEISALQILAFFRDMREAGLKPKTLLNVYVLLQKMLNLAVALELISSNPIQRVPKPKVERTEKPCLTPQQVRAVTECAPERFRALFVLLYLTGLRIGEALALKWSDTDLEQSKLYVRRSLWRGNEQTPKSRSAIRAKPLLGGLKRALVEHRGLTLYQKPEDYVFANGAGHALNPDDLRKRVLYPAMEKAGIQRTVRAFGFHLFRHSAGSLMHEATGDLKQTQSFLGHSGISVTSDVYVHLQPDSAIGSMEKLEKAFFGDELCSTVLKPKIDEVSEVLN
jgi:integrase